MGPEASAYRTLGLTPGADPAAVEAAYRTLIKRYHPDRQGGDAARAAEINRAYQQIRKAQQLPAVRRSSFPVVPPQQNRQPPKRGPRMLGLALIVALVVIAADPPIVDRSLAGLQELTRERLLRPGASRSRPMGSDLSAQFSDQPLDSDAIDRSVLSAVRISGAGEVDRLTSQSRRCHAELRRQPLVSRFDQCVAFDEAAVVLLQRDQFTEAGQFGSAAVTGRHLGAARLFSQDYLMIESRLDRIRSRVEFSLAPPDPQPLSQLEL